jgi:hypothetical protein
MPQPASNPSDVKLLNAPGAGATVGMITSAAGTSPPRQLSELPKDELEHLAEEYGLDPHDYRSRQHLVAAVHDRRQLIAAMDREAMMDVIKWGRRPIASNASKEHIAQEIVRIRLMRFAGLSHRGLVVLARLRGIGCLDTDPVPVLIRLLKKQEGFFSRLNRKRRSMIGSMVANMIGEDDASADYQFLPTSQAGPSAAGTSAGPAAHPGSPTNIKREIEESGLIGGIAGRIKKSADSYLNQKLDEIESRIDRKLDEIDRRLGEWRDKEIANRIRILKITLWASVIVGAFSLIYSYIKVYFVTPAPSNVPAQVDTASSKPK